MTKNYQKAQEFFNFIEERSKTLYGTANDRYQLLLIQGFVLSLSSVPEVQKEMQLMIDVLKESNK